MKVAVHYQANSHQDSYAPRWIETLEKCDVEVLAIDFKASNIIDKIRGCDGVMWHWFHSPDDKQSAPKILQAIELVLKIPVFPCYQTAWHYDDKVAQHYLMDALGAPKIPTWIFWQYKDAINFVGQCEYPIIFKLSVGAGSANVLKLDSFEEAKVVVDKIFKEGIFPYTLNEYAPGNKPTFFMDRLKTLKKMICYALYAKKGEYPPLDDNFLPQKNYAYLQKFLPENKYDIRITVIGNKAFAYIRYNRAGDFRASGSGNFDVNPKNIPVEAVRIAHQISYNNGFQSMAFDFLQDENGDVLLSEISYCYVNWMIHDCPGYWDRELHWHDGQIWPEEAHVEYFLHYIKDKK